MEGLIIERRVIERSIFGTYEEIINDKDVNDIIATGIYYIGTNCLNCLEWSYLVVFKLTNDNIIQLCFVATARDVVVRCKSSKGWSVWKSLISKVQ